VHAEGDIRLDEIGPFKVARFSHMRAGESLSNLDDVDDEYVSVYTLDGDAWTLAWISTDQDLPNRSRMDGDSDRGAWARETSLNAPGVGGQT